MRFGIGTGCVVLLLMVAGPAVAGSVNPTVKLDVSATQVWVGAPLNLVTQNALMHPLLPQSRNVEDPAILFEPASATATQYWYNSTVIRDPNTGRPAYRMPAELQSRTLPIDTTKLYLTWAKDGADIRVLVEAARGAQVQVRPGAVLGLENPSPDPKRPRALDYTGTLFDDFSKRPANSGWGQFSVESIQGVGEVSMLIDGYDLRLASATAEREVHTGMSTSFETPATMREDYSFLILIIHSARIEFPPRAGAWEGYVANPQLSWNGPAEVRDCTGVLTLNQVSGIVQVDTLRLDGGFQASLSYSDAATATTAHLTANGRGVTSDRALAGEGRALNLAPQLGLGIPAGLGLGVLGLVALRALRFRSQGAAKPPAPPTPGPAPAAPAQPPLDPKDVGGALERVRADPLDGPARFALGIALLHSDQADEAARHLERSFRLSPESLLKFLEAPEFAEHRQRKEVRGVLARIHREQNWKVWSGYA